MSDSLNQELQRVRDHVKTEEMAQKIEFMVACKIPKADIAAILDITVRIIDSKYRAEYKRGGDRLNWQVVRSLFNKATDEKVSGASVDAAKFWMERHGGWKKESPLTEKNLNSQIASGMNETEKLQRFANLLKNSAESNYVPPEEDEDEETVH